jgi:hypothetical protein
MAAEEGPRLVAACGEAAKVLLGCCCEAAAVWRLLRSDWRGVRVGGSEWLGLSGGGMWDEMKRESYF